ncbi:hypothetical protein BTVI_23322 [Pitangus sulphuratus]|nr:hypothetical protein BTVI_23322 [Pitangus sulphuratus]
MFSQVQELTFVFVELQGDETRLSRDKPKGGKPELGVKSAAQLKCMYSNARNMGNKQEELEAIMQQESYDVVAITEMWWDDSHDWSAAMDGYKLFRRDRQGRRGGGVALYIRGSLDSVELEVSDNKVECLWVRIRGKANKADILVGVCYRPPNQDKEVDELFCQMSAGNSTQQRRGSLGGSRSNHSGVGSRVGLDDLGGLFQPS